MRRHWWSQHQSPHCLILQPMHRKLRLQAGKNKTWKEVWCGWNKHEKRRVERDEAPEMGRSLITEGLAAFLSLLGF